MKRKKKYTLKQKAWQIRKYVKLQKRLTKKYKKKVEKTYAKLQRLRKVKGNTKFAEHTVENLSYYKFRKIRRTNKLIERIGDTIFVPVPSISKRPKIRVKSDGGIAVTLDGGVKEFYIPIQMGRLAGENGERYYRNLLKKYGLPETAKFSFVFNGHPEYTIRSIKSMQFYASVLSEKFDDVQEDYSYDYNPATKVIKSILVIV